LKITQGFPGIVCQRGIKIEHNKGVHRNHMSKSGNPFVIVNVYSFWTYDSWESLWYLQCVFLFNIWIMGTPLLSSMFIPLSHMIPGNPFVIVNVYSFWTYDSWESLCYLQCVFLYDISFLGTPLLSSIFIPLWHVIPGNPFVIVNVYSSLTYDSWESLCYLQCLLGIICQRGINIEDNTGDHRNHMSKRNKHWR
jgi:hypothetical protein